MRRTIEDFRGPAREMAVELRGMVRRLAVGVARSSGLWQLLGYVGAGGERETFPDVEVYSGIGFGARPPASGTAPEVIVVNVGGRPGHPVVVATRDKGSEVSLEEDETAVWTTQSVIHIKASGEVWITDRAGGVAKKLVTWDDFTNHAHLTAGTGTPVGPTKLLPTPGAAFGATDGTQKLKAQ